MLLAKQILDKIHTKELTKGEAVSLLTSIFENSDDTNERIDSIEILGKIVPTQNRFFKFFENILVSEDVTHPLVRASALKVLIHSFPKRSIPVLKWAIKNRWSIVLSYVLLEETEVSQNSEIKEVRNLLLKGIKINYEDFKLLLKLHFLLVHEESSFMSEEPENGRVVGLDFSDLDKKLKRIPEIICRFSRLKYLNLSNNELKSLPNWICQFKDLKSLYLGGNLLTSLPECLLELKKLEDISLFSYNPKVNTIPKMLVEFAKQKSARKYVQFGVRPTEAYILGLLEMLSTRPLKKYNYSHKRKINKLLDCSCFKLDDSGHVIGVYIIGHEEIRIKIIPEQIGELKHLEELYLSGNQIQEIPESIGNLRFLKKLDLRLNKIESISDSFGKLTSLKYLNLSDNNLKEIPYSIVKKLVSLKEIGLSNNDILEKEIDEFYAEFYNEIEIREEQRDIKIAKEQGIETKYFRGALISKNDAGILQKIEKLTKKEFQLFAKLESDWGMSFTARKLYVNGLCLFDCNLKNFPDHITELKFLKKLYLGGNTITDLPESIYKFEYLRSLDLSYNSLKHIPISIGNLKLLKMLDLSFNKLEFLPKSLGNLVNLTLLNLERNLLLSLPQSIGNLSSLRELNLCNNPFSNLPKTILNLNSLYFLYIRHENQQDLQEKLKELEKIGVHISDW